MKKIPGILAICIVLIVLAFTLPKDVSKQERIALSQDFKFTKTALFVPDGLTPKTRRNIHPQYEKLAAWISALGVAVTFTDYDGDRLPNDIIQVDPRFDRVYVSPVPGTGTRFKPFELSVTRLPYDPNTMAPQGTLANDFNEDGKIDVLVYYWGRTPVIFYQQENGKFNQSELSSSLETVFSNSGTVADLDGDGHTDIFIGTYFPDESKMLEVDAKDRDQVMQHSMSRGDNGAKNRIYLWAGIKDGKVIYNECKDWLNNLHFQNDWTLAVAAGDINGDMLPELYIANDFGPDKLLYNTSTPGHLSFRELYGVKHFNTVSSSVLGKDSFKGMGVDFGDINDDGLLDIYVSNLSQEFGLLESHFAFINTGEFDGLKEGIAPFENESEKLGLSKSFWSWEAKFADFNNDGVVEALQATGFIKGKVNCWPELQELATANDEVLAHPESWPKLEPGVADISGDAHVPFFVRSKSGKYYDLASDVGIGEVQMTRGIAISDVEHDGRVDFASANQWEDSKFYHNNSSARNAYLGLSLRVPQESNSLPNVSIDTEIPSRDAVGAVARLKLPNGKTKIAFVDGGNGHSGKNSSEIHFGLGNLNAGQDLEVHLTWKKNNGKTASTIIKVKPGWHTINLPY